MTSGSNAAGPSVAELEDLARRGRAQVIRAVAHANGGHIGGPLSAMDMMVALYFQIMRIRPEEPHWPDRDRFILSKGHSAIGLYTVLALRGYFPVAELQTFDGIDSRLQGHPDMAITPGVDMSSGSLGLGFSGGLGIALGGRAAGKDFTTYVMLGDGECNEGIVWEAAHVAQRYALDNLVAIIDHNKLQQFGWRGAVGRRPPAPLHRHPARRPLDGLRLEGARDERARHGRDRLDRRGRPRPPRRPGGHRRPHDQGQGRLVHGGQLRVAHPGPQRR